MNYCRSLACILSVMSLWAFASDAVGGTMKKCIAPDGRIEFTDLPCPLDARSLAVENKTPHQQTQQISRLAKSGITLGGLPVADRLKSCEPGVAIAAAEEVVSNPASLNEPMHLFSPAYALFQNGRKDEGVFWFYAAQLRVRQQLVIDNGDRGQILSIMLMTIGGPINNYALQNTSKLNQILDRVLEWDKKAMNPFRDQAKARKLDKQMDQVYAGFGELKSKLVAEKAAMETAARQAAPGMEQLHAQMNNDRCRKGQPDPAYENQRKKDEQQLALDFVTHNDQLIKLVGGQVKAVPASSTTYSNDSKRARYEFSIVGSRSLFAIVEVNRSSGKPALVLACVTTLSLGHREASREACSQSPLPLPK